MLCVLGGVIDINAIFWKSADGISLIEPLCLCCPLYVSLCNTVVWAWDHCRVSLAYL